MTTLKKTYRLVAALTLMLFACTIVLPAGLAAASLSCDMEMSHSIPACCNAADMNNHHEKKKDSHDCQQQAFCEMAIDNNPSKTLAISQSIKIVIASELLDELTTIETDNDHPPAIKDEPSLHYHPPIFLLNSTFLN